MKIEFKHIQGNSTKAGVLRVSTPTNSFKLEKGTVQHVDISSGERIIITYGPVKEEFNLPRLEEESVIEISVNKVDLEYSRTIQAVLFGLGTTIKAEKNGQSLIDKKYVHTRREVLISVAITALACISSLIYIAAEIYINPQVPLQPIIIIGLLTLSVMYSALKVYRNKEERHMAFNIVFFSFISCLMCEVFLQNPNPLSVFALVLSGFFAIGSIFLSSWFVKPI